MRPTFARIDLPRRAVHGAVGGSSPLATRHSPLLVVALAALTVGCGSGPADSTPAPPATPSFGAESVRTEDLDLAAFEGRVAVLQGDKLLVQQISQMGSPTEIYVDSNTDFWIGHDAYISIHWESVTETAISGSSEVPASRSELMAATEVSGYGTRNPDGSIHALVIHIHGVEPRSDGLYPLQACSRKERVPCVSY